MLSCTEAEFVISQLVDLELGSRQEQKLKHHIDCCPRCHSLMKDDEDTTRLLTQTLTPDPELLSSIRFTILTQAAEAPVVHGPFWYQRRPLMLAAGFVFGISVFLGVVTLKDPPPTSLVPPAVVDGTPTNPSLSPRPVLFLKQNFQQVEPFDSRGEESLGVRYQRDRTIVTDALAVDPEHEGIADPGSVDSADGAVRLEIEKVDRTFFKFVNNQWQ